MDRLYSRIKDHLKTFFHIFALKVAYGMSLYLSHANKTINRINFKNKKSIRIAIVIISETIKGGLLLQILH